MTRQRKFAVIAAVGAVALFSAGLYQSELHGLVSPNGSLDAPQREAVPQPTRSIDLEITDTFDTFEAPGLASYTLASEITYSAFDEKKMAEKSTMERAARARAFSRMTGAVADLARAGGSQPVTLVVAYNSDDSTAREAEDTRIAALKGEVAHTYDHIPFKVVTIAADSLMSLAMDNNVRIIDVDRKIELSSRSARMAARLPSLSTTTTVPFSTAVAVIDSGISDHVDLYVADHFDCTGAASDS